MSGTPALLEEAVEAHGGRASWEAASRIGCRVRTGGLLPRARMVAGMVAEYRLEIDIHEPRATLHGFPEKGKRGEFTPGEVSVRTRGGSRERERSNPRDAFGGLGAMRRSVRWDALDILYFGGYAMWNYLTLPFLLLRPEIEVRPHGRIDDGGTVLRGLHARFPEGFPTHNREQVVWFDAAGRVRRHDYTASVVAPLARAAHYTDEYVTAGGLTLPSARRALPRAGRESVVRAPVLVSLQLDGHEVV
ncbi:MAG: hypothetical protein ACR2NA_12475 [Solirubrobacterales bacterium]